MSTLYNLYTNFNIPSKNIKTLKEQERYNEYINDAFITIKSKISYSPRGEWYKYALLFKGKITTIGAEKGYYAGGELISIYSNNKEEIKTYIKNMASGDSYDKDLYLKIYNLEIADKNEVDAFKKSAIKYAKQLKFNK